MTARRLPTPVNSLRRAPTAAYSSRTSSLSGASDFRTVPELPMAGPSFSQSSMRSVFSSQSLRKGKQRAIEPLWLAGLRSAGPNRLPLFTGSRSSWPPRLNNVIKDDRYRPQIRSFHATTRREALPLIPATLGIIKSTSALTLVTTIVRVLISFFPIGTFASIQLVRSNRWLNELAKPPASHDAEEFWLMWCKGEKGTRPSAEDAKAMMDGQMREDGGLEIPDGRVTYPIPLQPGRFHERIWKGYKDPTSVDRITASGRDMTGRIIHLIRRTRYFLPALPSASMRSYNELNPSERDEVEALRRYWVSMKLFKDSFRWARILATITLVLPFLLVGAVYLASMETVPLTGRMRIILLTPEEEDKISTSLAGMNWFRTIINLLTTPDHPAPPVLPKEDWRWSWVEGVLRRLEVSAMIESRTPITEAPQAVKQVGSLTVPAAKYPLKPRPRMSSMLHAALPGGESSSGQEHLEIGPPYSLLLLRQGTENAFSYGYGGKGASGIVVYTGLLDSILRDESPVEVLPRPKQSRFSLSSVLGLSSAPASSHSHCQPTEEQTLHLACILAHEIGHLLLSHHLETLSEQHVLWPSMLGLSMDLIRACIWPLTIFLGPTVNDALANVGRTSVEEISTRLSQAGIGFQWKHEYEADLVSMRLLALAGFDPSLALDQFVKTVSGLHQVQKGEVEEEESWTGQVRKFWTRATHPSAEQRREAMVKELERWEKEQSKV